jgi:hypothetical protein
MVSYFAAIGRIVELPQVDLNWYRQEPQQTRTMGKLLLAQFHQRDDLERPNVG